MSFKGTFSRYTSNRISGHIFISFSLKCTNLMFGETIDIGLFPSDGSQPWYYRNLKFKAGQTYVFNYDSIDWNWCQGDYIAILEAGNKVTQKWVLQLKEYGPGECPECHGIHKCRHCRGTGFAKLAIFQEESPVSVVLQQVYIHFKTYSYEFQRTI